jgi:Multiubiquitin
MEIMMDNEKVGNSADDVVDAIREEILDEIADLEDYARRGEAPPHCRGYRFKVNGEPFVVHERFITGQQVLELAGLIPPQDYTLRVKVAGQRPQKVDLNEKVDLRQPGIEKFKALPRDQTEG